MNSGAGCGRNREDLALPVDALRRSLYPRWYRIEDIPPEDFFPGGRACFSKGVRSPRNEDAVHGGSSPSAPARTRRALRAPRPMMPVKFTQPDGSGVMRTGVLDTGAEDTVLPDWIATALGLDLNAAERRDRELGDTELRWCQIDSRQK